jgi:hypothetical protein
VGHVGVEEIGSWVGVAERFAALGTEETAPSWS